MVKKASTRHQRSAGHKSKAKTQRAKATKSKKPLNKVEEKQVKTITKRAIIRNGELRYCAQIVWDAGLPTDSPPQYNQADRVPVPIPNTGLGSSAYCLGFETGLALGVESTSLNALMPPDVGTQQCMTPIGMYNFPAFNDPASDNRDPGTMRNGEYMYAHSMRVRLQINMEQARDTTTNYLPVNVPAQFRILVVKRRPGRVIADDAGVNLATELFRNFDNNVTGLVTTKTIYQLDHWPVNTESLVKDKDIRFKLSPPVNPVAGSGGNTQFSTYGNSYNSFPSTKNIDLWLPKPKHKIKWNGSADADPRDSFNYKLQILVLAYYPNGGNTASSQFPGVAPCKFWNCKLYTESKFREP